MSRVRERGEFYRAHGLDVGPGDTLHGVLTPELIEALVRLKDLLVVHEVQGSRPIRIELEVPPELEASLRTAMGTA